MVSPNIVMKFQNVNIFFGIFCDILDPSSAHACCMVCVNESDVEMVYPGWYFIGFKLF